MPVLEKRMGQQVWRAMYDPLKSRTTFIAIVVPEDKLNGVAPLVRAFLHILLLYLCCIVGLLK